MEADSTPQPAPESMATPVVSHWFQSALDLQLAERKPWASSLAPAYIGLFLWIVFFDQLPREALRRGGLPWAFLGCAVGGALAYLLFFLPTALWGLEARRPLTVVATRTFGLRGAAWVPVLLVGVIQVVWLAVSIRYGVSLCLEGLVRVRLLDVDRLQPVAYLGQSWPSWLYAATALLWLVFIGLAGRYLVRVVSALMNVYPAAVAVIVGVSTIWAFPGLRGQATLSETMTTLSAASSSVVVAQMILGFFATAGLLAVDWGAVGRDRGEVRQGGAVCVGVAGWIVATLSFLTVVGAGAKVRVETSPSGLLQPMTFSAALPALFGDWVGGGLLLALSLTALAPGCYAAYLFGVRMHELWPGRSRSRWTVAGTTVAWMLVMVGGKVTLFEVFTVIGALVAPTVGAMAADFTRSKGRWDGPRAGVNWIGVVAWAVGVAVGITPLVADATAHTTLRYRQPAVLLAFIASAFTYYLLAGVTAEAPTVAGIVPPPKESSSGG